MNMKQKINKKGFTLIEMLVSVALFSVIILSATRIFQLVVRSQRNAIASQTLQENIKYFFEVVSRETRMSIRTSGNCLSLPNGEVFAVNAENTELYLKNEKRECVTYSVSDGRFQIDRDGTSGYLTPSIMTISDLKFIIDDGPAMQPRVTIHFISSTVGINEEEVTLNMQTTLSSRSYK